MRRRRIGDLEVSVLGIGGNTFGTDFFGPGCDADTVTRILRTALDAGVDLVDTAEEYSITSFLGEGHSEELIGRALGSRRDEAVLSTKFLGTDADDPDRRERPASSPPSRRASAGWAPIASTSTSSTSPTPGRRSRRSSRR